MKRLKNHITKLSFLILIALLPLSNNLQSQTPGYNTSTGQKNNYISTGVPILQIAPDAISGSLGDAGVASEADVYSSHWNNAKLAFAPKELSVSITYTPWLHKLDADMNFLYLGAYKRINKRSAVGASLTYFTLGRLEHTGEHGEDLGTFIPNEFALDATYSMKLSENLSLGATARFIHSDLTQGMEVEEMTTKAANGLAADVGLYYEQDIDKSQQFAFGLHISNLGSKLSYSDDETSNSFLPANLRLGGRYTYNIDDYNRINVLLDLNKLLVPTPPIISGDTVISKYYRNLTDYNRTSSMLGAIQSFYDAPGGFKEELHEIMLSLGAEYWYSNTFAARIGYFYEHATKGARQYLTLGVGVRYSMMSFDFSYLVPTSSFSTNPLANTIRVSITWNMEKAK
ncbi:MAG: type IX secretion system outer membrane channel protein PorV [Bacteroidales bacterium]|nr:type IX secretion system outer membrane channel protein PorV [Bacteroidales bacterium]